MYSGYYKPYWDSSDELEHVGVKGMKWGKKKTQAQLQSTPFKKTTVGETGAWIAANFQWDPESKTLKAPAITARTSAKMNTAKTKLKLIAKDSANSLSSKIVAFGQKIVDSILSKFKKNQNRS